MSKYTKLIKEILKARNDVLIKWTEQHSFVLDAHDTRFQKNKRNECDFSQHCVATVDTVLKLSVFNLLYRFGLNAPTDEELLEGFFGNYGDSIHIIFKHADATANLFSP